MERGPKLILADPRESEGARLSLFHLPGRPVEDPALLAGMLHGILGEELYDRNFVGSHVDGLDALLAEVAGFPPEVAARRAGVDPDQLVAAARMFAGGTRGAASTGTGPEMAGRGTLTE